MRSGPRMSQRGCGEFLSKKGRCELFGRGRGGRPCGVGEGDAAAGLPSSQAGRARAVAAVRRGGLSPVQLSCSEGALPVTREGRRSGERAAPRHRGWGFCYLRAPPFVQGTVAACGLCTAPTGLYAPSNRCHGNIRCPFSGPWKMLPNTCVE